MNNTDQPNNTPTNSGYTQCLHCKNDIKIGAIKCKHCHRWLNEKHQGDAEDSPSLRFRSLFALKENSKLLYTFLAILVLFIVMDFGIILDYSDSHSVNVIGLLFREIAVFSINWFLLVAGMYGVFKVFGVKENRNSVLAVQIAVFLVTAWLLFAQTTTTMRKAKTNTFSSSVPLIGSVNHIA